MQATTRQRGFTLIELMIVVIIVGILAAVAYPAYQNSVRSSRRADAHTAAALIQQAQERFRANRSCYTNRFDSATGATNCFANGLKLKTGTTSITTLTSESEYYDLVVRTVDPATGNCDNAYTNTRTNLGSAYCIVATAKTGTTQARDTACTTMTSRILNGNVTQTPAACWRK